MKIVKEIFSVLLFNRIIWSKYCQVYLNLFEDINEDGGEDLCLNPQNKIAQKVYNTLYYKNQRNIFYLLYDSSVVSSNIYLF